MRVAGADRVDAEGVGRSWVTGRGAPPDPGRPRSGGVGHLDRERDLLALGPRLDLPDARAVEHADGRRRRRGPWADPARSNARLLRLRPRASPFLRNRTVTDGPLAYWMPFPVLCDSANTSRCGCGDAARSALSTSGKNVLGSGVLRRRRPTRRRRANRRRRVRRRHRAHHRGTRAVTAHRMNGRRARGVREASPYPACP